MSADTNYCHNCRHDSQLRDGVFCGYCLDFYYANGRLPVKSDPIPDTSAMARLYAAMGWAR
jgi:hypothetical protein